MIKPFSIIVPIYNSELYLEKCIKSILDQSYRNFELILINDGSNDKSLMICEKYAEIDERIIVVNKENEGVSAARNSGIDAAIGKYLTFIDSDDWITADFLKEVYETIVSNEPDLIVTGLSFDYIEAGYNVLHEVTETKYSSTEKEIGEQIITIEKKYLFGYACSKFYKTDLVKKNDIRFNQKITYMEDLLFNCDYFKIINSLSVIDGAFYHYIIREGYSMSSKFTPELYMTVKIVRSKINALYDFWGIKSGLYPVNLPNGYIRGVQSCIYNLFHVNCAWSFKKKIYHIKELISDYNLKADIKTFDSTDIFSTLFLILFRTQNAYLIYIVYSILFKSRRKFNKLYWKFRKGVLEFSFNSQRGGV